MSATKGQFESIFDLINGAVGYRYRSGMFRKHAVVRAVGLKVGQDPVIVDATAGLGRDAFLLASAGARVTLLERSPEVFALLQDSLAKVRAAEPELAAVAGRMNLIFGDSRYLLRDLKADVVLVDPMHPSRHNTALVKKEMRLLKQLVGADSDAGELMQAALAASCKRVVLKWPLRAPLPEGVEAPSHTIAGKTVRYDVYMRSFAANQGASTVRSTAHPVQRNGNTACWTPTCPSAIRLGED